MSIMSVRGFVARERTVLRLMPSLILDVMEEPQDLALSGVLLKEPLVIARRDCRPCGHTS